MKIRRLASEDHEKVSSLLQEAFYPSRYESRLVELLRSHRKPLWEWVIEDELGLLGYIAYTLAFREGKAIGYHLAPVAVCVKSQRKGIGSQLILESLSQMMKWGSRPVFVLGDPKYYSRLGFHRVSRTHSVFDPNRQHFLAMNWTDAEEIPVGYEGEFYDLES